MNKKNNRKGFTTVELVIVIAVIAILATVLIPTFSNLIGKAEESAALQEANNIFKSYFIGTATDSDAPRDFFIEVDGYYFEVVDGELQNEAEENTPAAGSLIVTAADEDPFFATEPVATEAPTEEPTT